ncbi:2Fe-2S iron-sulfur cluster-binding protein [Sphingobium sufflavum]|uniref:2Fe-2S iron-sulfur cluster-binding protein n=1 Tax=Sphingobium sufflavum TaxID=1129547 RepID=UPI001F3DE90D|nr:2Fe-2S iron-sulfur cluster-binding protein [Sphingobium sufflavum]MCE7796135.1 2Fe-2S iron-sulfur cluster-binding protein [Sphingobium sufflavum]
MTHIRLRLNRDGSEEIARFDLPDDPAESGISGTWEGASVSTALQYLQRKVDPSLAYVLSCRRGLCDLCAVRIDGKVETACTTPLRDGMLIEPTRASLQLRDTVVELSLVRRHRVA